MRWGVLMGIELVLNGANINISSPSVANTCAPIVLGIGLDGQLIALFVIVLAAAEAAGGAGPLP